MFELGRVLGKMMFLISHSHTFVLVGEYVWRVLLYA